MIAITHGIGPASRPSGSKRRSAAEARRAVLMYLHSAADI